jgi:hypothetical protein
MLAILVPYDPVVFGPTFHTQVSLMGPTRSSLLMGNYLAKLKLLMKMIENLLRGPERSEIP